MKHIKYLAFLIFAITVFNSCTDDFETEGEITGKKIQALINDEHISHVEVRVLAFNNGYSYYHTEVSATALYTIEGQFLKTDGTYYNLNKLIKYENVERTLELYFDGY